MCLALVAALAAVGVGVEERLHRADLTVPNSGAERARQLAAEHFGESSPLVVMLEGPRRTLDAQGRELARRLDRKPNIAVLGPWVAGADRRLRPTVDSALVMVRISAPFEESSRDYVPIVRREVERATTDPVLASVTGYPDIARGIHEESVTALERAELLAAPLLLLVLLLVFRSPVAAAMPLVLGLMTIVAGRGLIDIANRFVELDVLALNMASMMGLALGVDYSLLIVSRFREELAGGASVADAVATARRTAGHTVVFAGLALIVAMVAAGFVAPGRLFLSSGVGVLVSAGLSMAGAVVVLPALLGALGHRVNAWSFGGGEGSRSGGWGGLAVRSIRRPALAAGIVLFLIGGLAAPAFALSMGSPDPRVLPDSSKERRDFERVQRVLSPGWTAPYDIVVASPRGPVTDPERLKRVVAWQDELAREQGVAAVLGPGEIARRTRSLDVMRRELDGAGSQLARARRDQRRLADGLARVDRGVSRLRTGLGEAAAGASAIEAGAGSAAGGARQIRDGLGEAADGADELLAGLREADAGVARLADGGGEARSGARRLEQALARARVEARRGLPRVGALRRGLAEGSSGLRQLKEPAATAHAELEKALDALDAMAVTSKLDPAYRRAYEAVATAFGNISGIDPRSGKRAREDYDGLAAELGTAAGELARGAEGVAELERGTRRLVSGLGALERGARRLRVGIGELEDGARELAAGTRRLRAGGAELNDGLARLRAGGDRLAGGAGRLRDGAGELEDGLSSGARRTTRLESGVGRIRDGIADGRRQTERLARGLTAGGGVSGDIVDSGYLTLAGLDAARPDERSAASLAVNLDEGGSATRLVVISDRDPTNAGDPVRDRLDRSADAFEKRTGMRAEIGGPAAALQDFDEATTERLIPLILTLVGVTYLVLIPILRSLLLPLVAVALNVLTVAAAFGVLALGFLGSAPLGGPGELDAIMILAIFAIVFGLSIDYEVFLLARMREGYERTGDTEEAIAYGLRHTAGVITGAALIMAGVFVSFALAGIVSMRQLGIGLTVAVLLDATLVRLVLLPAVIRLCGDAAWWLPASLERRLATRGA